MCVNRSIIPVRFGIDAGTQSIKPCADSNCVNCIDNYQTCTECDTANGYILVSGSCFLKFLIAPLKLDRLTALQDVAFQYTFPETVCPDLIKLWVTDLKPTIYL